MSNVVDGRTAGGRFSIPRSRGAASGILIVALGVWGALVPFVGPAFDFAYNPDQGSGWSAARGWLEVLPGVVAVIGGLLLLRSRNRATAVLGAWVSVIAGAWFVVGRVAATTLTIGEIGRPAADTDTKAAWLELTYFYGLGAVIVFLGAVALGRVSIRSVRDVNHAQRAAALRHDGDVEVVDDRDRPADTGSIPEQRVHHGELVPPRPRRTWRNPLGTARRDPVEPAAR